MSSKWASNLGNQNWKTPKYLFDILQKNFNIVLDAATSKDNPLNTPIWYTQKDNGLNQKWYTWTYCNPPYGETELWVKKAHFEMLAGNYSILLLPANTDTNWFHLYIWNKYYDQPQDGVTVKFIHKRVYFIGAEAPAKFSSMIVIFGGNLYRNRYFNMLPEIKLD